MSSETRRLELMEVLVTGHDMTGRDGERAQDLTEENLG